MLSLEARLLVLSLLWAGSYLLQRFLVGKRRCSDHWFVQYGAMAGYYLPAPVAFSAASTLYYSPSHINQSFRVLVYGVLVMFCYTIFASSIPEMPFTNMRSYSLRDRPGDRYSFLKWLVLFVVVQWECARICWLYQLGVFIGIVMVAFVVLFPKPPASTLDCQTKAVADYMMQRKSSKSSSTSPFFDDDANYSPPLDCCRYPFVQGKDGEWVTVKDLVDRDKPDDLPNEDRDKPDVLPNEDRDKPDDRDIWLSYSLSLLLARRYYGFHPAEEGDDKVRRFVVAGLGTTDGYKRAFSIVEVQLAFLHDYFFTASLPIMESGQRWIENAQLLPFLSTLVISFFLKASFIFYGMSHSTSGIVLPTLYNFVKEWSDWEGFPRNGTGPKCAIAIPGVGDHLVGKIQTLVLEVLLMFMSWCMLFGMPISSLLVRNILAFYWRPIHTAFRKLNRYLPIGRPASMISVVMSLFRARPNPNTQYVFDPFQTKAGGAYWRNKIGQYSILQDYDRRRSPKKALVAWFQVTMLSQPSYKFIKHLPVEEEEVDIKKLDSLRKLVADTLQAIDGPPTNGSRSLKINRDSADYEPLSRSRKYDWLWTCKQETHTDTILIWHIATSYCDMTPSSYGQAARALSRYCAYLVAFLPEFLPEHSLTTKQVFQRVLQEAQQELGTKPMKDEEKRTKIRGLQLPDQHEQQTTFHKGVELGRQLEMIDDDKVRWSFIEEFWAETILYVAPSDNAEAHIEHLAKGGEFITHLWAMLSNAGILKRATGEWHQSPASTTTEGPLTKTEITNVPTQGCIVPSNDEASTSSMSSPPIHTSEPPTNEKGKQPQILEIMIDKV